MPKKKTTILQYSVVFEPATEGGYNVSFPSFPGCVTFGKNFEEAKTKAQELLELWLQELAARGEEIPVHQARPIVDEVAVKIPSRFRSLYASPRRQAAY